MNLDEGYLLKTKRSRTEGKLTMVKCFCCNAAAVTDGIVEYKAEWLDR